MSQIGADDDSVTMIDVEEGQNGTANGTSTKIKDDKAKISPHQMQKRVSFSTYLKSRLVELVVGDAESDKTTLNAHQDLLMMSPYFTDRISKLGPGDPSIIYLPEEDLSTLESFLEFLYTKEYFPRKVVQKNQETLEEDNEILLPDETGTQLLRHAKVFTLAKKFGVDELYELAFRKVHLVPSSASAEIAYARYVYQSSDPSDKKIRDPVRTYWASQSHELRHEVKDEFRQMCLDFPEFGYDVLSLVLDHTEKTKPVFQAPQTREHGSARKRMRSSETPR